jgi:PTH1 family peptidyl-tRNA hydrolase
MKKILLVGLGNPGEEYAHTRHNIGFQVLDAMASAHKVRFELVRHGWLAQFRSKGALFMLLKPNTYMNLSGKAVQYWLSEEHIASEAMLVITDDLALPFGVLRMKGKGGDGGHNGLKSIEQALQTQNYARLRFGVGSDFQKGQQVDYVLGKWNSEEHAALSERIDRAVQASIAFGAAGLQLAMTQFNGT